HDEGARQGHHTRLLLAVHQPQQCLRGHLTQRAKAHVHGGQLRGALCREDLPVVMADHGEDGEVHATLARRAVTERAWAYASDPSDGVDVADAGQVRLTPSREWGNRGAGTMRVFMPTA